MDGTVLLKKGKLIIFFIAGAERAGIWLAAAGFISYQLYSWYKL